MTDNKIYIGVDLGGTTIKIGLAKAGQVLAHTKIAADANQGLFHKLPHIESAVRTLMNQQNLDHEQLGGIGLAFPSIVDSKGRKILSRYVKFSDANELDLPGWAKNTWGIPLALENDAKAALAGEWQYGAARGKAFAVMVTLGTGVGTAVIMDGKLLRGAHCVAGNLGGHTIINFKGTPCNCGSWGCVETEASGWVLNQKSKTFQDFGNSRLAELDEVDFKSVFEAAAGDDQVAQKIRDHCLEVWSALSINLVHSFDPEVIIFGGGVMNSGDEILPFIQKKVDENCWLPPGSVRMVPAKLKEDAGLLGVAYLASMV